MTRRDLQKIIQNTALELFREKGYEAVTVLEICQKCRITKPTFYKFASSKGSLLIHYYADLLRVPQMDWDNMEAHGSWWNCIEDTMSFYVDAFTQNGWELVSHLFIHNFDTGDESIFTFQDHLMNSMADVIANAVKEGSITNPADSMELSVMLVDMLFGYVGYWTLNKGDFDIKERFMSMMKHTLGYVEDWGEAYA